MSDAGKTLYEVFGQEAREAREIRKVGVRTIVLFGVKGGGKDTVGDLLAPFMYLKEAFAGPIKEMVRLAFPRFTHNDLYGSSEARERQEPGYPMGDKCLRCDRPLVSFVSKSLRKRLDAVGAPLPRPELGSYLVCSNTECNAEYPAFVNARIALQTLGTEWGRRLYPNVWVDACFARICECVQQAIAYTRRFSPGPPDPPARSTNFVVTDGRFKNELARSKALGAFCVKLTRGLAGSTSQHPSEAEFREIPDSAFDYILDNAAIPFDGMAGAVERMLCEVS